MARLKHATSGVIVSVADGAVGRLGSEWGPVNAERSDSPDSSWKVADLKAYAEENSIDLGEATKKDDIVAAITASGSGE